MNVLNTTYPRVEKHLEYDKTFNGNFIANLLLNVPQKKNEFSKSVNI